MSSQDALDEPQPEISDTNLQESESGINQLEYNGIRYDKLAPEDIIGVKFVTVEAAETFYYTYAKAMGFDVRKDDKRTSARTGRVTIRKWVCSAEGERLEKYMDNNNNVRMPKKLTRCHCPCLFKVRYFKEKNSYVVVDFKTDHSHDLAQPQESHFLRSHRSVPDSHLALATSMRRVSIKTCHAYQYMADISGGFANVGFKMKDLYNKLDSSQHEIVLEGDAKATLAYLEGKAAEDKKLFCKYSTYESNRLANLFWRDSTSLLDYCCFGDVLVFDSTYKTNHYGKPLVLFVGSNNHLLTTIFGFALLVDETVETYTWVLQMFLESMEGKKPLGILTDGDEAMRKAIELVVPGCPHRLCTWHISKNAQKKLHNPETVAEFRRCMFDETTPCGFEQRWRAMVEKYGLHNRNWVKMMYDKREKWAEAFVSGHFFARMRSTQRCERMNRYVKDSLSFSGVKLIELIPQLDKALERLRNKVAEEDFRSNNSAHALSTQLRQLEKHASTIYTDNVFQLICVEIDRVGGLITSRIMHLNSCRVYITSSYNNDEEKECTTTYYHRESDPRVVCSCKLYECEGIPCSHLFNVMKHERMREIPLSLVLKRWTKQAKSEVHSTVPKENMPSEAAWRFKLFK
ncbi:protein FAR1-RELATED SEQUENCE 5 isoform X2 [Rosa chinensis]|uniref:protein FAR1-RELATED SEQUENCE 5 isoform X2 n=1 Tax=Rosa chinensis TaxID=74649 RepID=UPI001AD8A433|nr:protein FAR1-RELATED SEQUENCE 5 isoform X2 [Rosa chinensis]